MPTESAAESSSRYLSTGPLVWVATISCTTLLLALLKQALWLVVPFLLAIILYYALFPAVRRLTLAGVARETAAALVAGSFFVAATAVMVPTVSWLAGTPSAAKRRSFATSKPAAVSSAGPSPHWSRSSGSSSGWDSRPRWARN